MVNIRPAQAEDCEALHRLILELAIFERAEEMMVNTTERLLKDGFGEQPQYTCFVAEMEAVVVGMSFCYTRYSTWIGKVLYLEDLIVQQDKRGEGIGKLLMDYTIAYAKANGFARVSWQVLDWNTPAIDFYKKYNAEFDPEWLNVWVDLR